MRKSTAGAKAIGVIALFAATAGLRAQNDYPPPQSVLPDIMGKPIEQQAIALGGRTDALDQHLYATDGRQQQQRNAINDMTVTAATNAQVIVNLVQKVKELEDAASRKETNQWSRTLVEIAASVLSGGVALDRVRERRAKKEREDEG